MEVDDIQLSQTLKGLLIACAEKGIVTIDMLQTLANNLNYIDGSQVPQLNVYADGTLLRGVVRRGRVTVLNISSLTSLGQDSFNEFDFIETPKDNDIFLLRQNSSGQNVTVDFATAVNFTGATTSDFTLRSEYIAFIYNQRDGVLHELYRSGFGTPGSTPLSRYEVVTAVGTTLTVPEGVTYIGIQSVRTGATGATATWQVTAVGTNATATLYYDDGINGQVLLGSATWAGVPTPLQVVDDARDAINALTATHGFTAVNDGVDLLTVTADPNLGATANGWLFYEVLTGGMTSTIAVPNFAGGVNGVDADQIIDTISGVGVDTVLIIENIMPAKKFTFISGGNITTDQDINLFPLDVMFAMVTDSGAIKLFSCCKRQLTGTRVVDPAGVVGFGLKNFTYPYSNIAAALDASSALQNVIVLPNNPDGGAVIGYDEKNLLRFNVGLHFDKYAYVAYTGATAGSLFDDGANGYNGVVHMNITSDMEANLSVSSNIVTFFDNTSASGSAGCFYLENNSKVRVKGGHWKGTNYFCSVAQGTLEVSDAQISGKIKVSGGAVVLRNCRIYSNTQVPIDISGGILILDNCVIETAWNNAAGHGINMSGGANTGEVYLIGTNRIILADTTTPKCITSGSAKDVRKMGTLYSTNAVIALPAITDKITGAALAIVMDVDVQ